MFEHFKAISISHKDTPLAVRELLALDEIESRKLLKYLKDFTEISDVLVLSTCNRTEVYYTSQQNKSLDIIKLIGIGKAMEDVSRYHHYFRNIENQEEAIDHLFRVSVGLEAQVAGDLQITNQVKRAYQMSAEEGLAGPLLHRLMHTIFYTNKRVVQETPFRDGAASVSYAATELISELTTHIIDPKILIIGLGEIGADVCKNLSGYNFQNVYVANRTLQTAKSVATNCGFQTLPFENITDQLNDFDVILSSLSGDRFKINRAQISRFEIPGYKYFIDLGVPRSIEQEVEELSGVVLYNIDNIKSKTSQALSKRLKAIPRVEAIIEESIQEFSRWTKEKSISPTINKLKNALEKIRQEEVARYMKELDIEEKKRLEKITKGMMQKIIKLPVLQLKAACKRGQANSLIDVLNDLFNLEEEKDKITRD